MLDLVRVTVVALAALALTGAAPTGRSPMSDGALVAARVMRLMRDTTWTPAGVTKLRFRTFHPQGMIRVGDDLFVSSVEVRTPPRHRGVGQERDVGAGVGHLLKVGPDGALRGEVTLGEGAAYHPGGIDFDGRWLWVPVSEYRPDSRALVYRVDPATLKAQLVFRFADHIGAVAFDRASRTLTGVSWGSRRFHRWAVSRTGGVPPAVAAAGRPVANPSHYVDLQDCHGAGAGRMLCSGLAAYRTAPNTPAFQLGGLELIDTAHGRPLWQVPVPLWSPSGRPMTQNPAFVEATPRGLRAWFLPDDEDSTLFAFEAAPPDAPRDGNRLRAAPGG